MVLDGQEGWWVSEFLPTDDQYGQSQPIAREQQLLSRGSNTVTGEHLFPSGGDSGLRAEDQAQDVHRDPPRSNGPLPSLGSYPGWRQNTLATAGTGQQYGGDVSGANNWFADSTLRQNAYTTSRPPIDPMLSHSDNLGWPQHPILPASINNSYARDVNPATPHAFNNYAMQNLYQAPQSQVNSGAERHLNVPDEDLDAYPWLQRGLHGSNYCDPASASVQQLPYYMPQASYGRPPIPDDYGMYRQDYLTEQQDQSAGKAQPKKTAVVAVFDRSITSIEAAKKQLFEPKFKMVKFNIKNDDVDDWQDNDRKVELATRLFNNLLRPGQDLSDGFDDDQKQKHRISQDKMLTKCQNMMKGREGVANASARCLLTVEAVEKFHLIGMPEKDLNLSRKAAAELMKKDLSLKGLRIATMTKDYVDISKIFSQRFEKVADIIKKDKRVACDVFRGHCVDELVQALDDYLNRKFRNWGTNNVKLEEQQKGREQNEGCSSKKRKRSNVKELKYEDSDADLPMEGAQVDDDEILVEDDGVDGLGSGNQNRSGDIGDEGVDVELDLEVEPEEDEESFGGSEFGEEGSEDGAMDMRQELAHVDGAESDNESDNIIVAASRTTPKAALKATPKVISESKSKASTGKKRKSISTPRDHATPARNTRAAIKAKPPAHSTRSYARYL